jgi:stalled ribosome alternative rescue factor ArfA
MTKLKSKNKIKEILYTRQYLPKKVKPKKGKGSFKRKKK